MNDKDVKKIVLVLTIGLCEAIRSKAVSIGEAQHYLFSPYTMRLLGYDAELENVIHIGTEFENIARLLPDDFDQAVLDLAQLAETTLKRMPPPNYQEDPKWVDKLLPVQASERGRRG